MPTLDNISFLKSIKNDPDFQVLTNLITTIMELPDSDLNSEAVDILSGMITGSFTQTVREESITNILNTFKGQGLNKTEVSTTVKEVENQFNNIIEELQPTELKKQLLKEIFNIFINLFKEAEERFGVYDIELPIMLEEGAQMPAYAHETDACADLFIAEDTIIPAHTMSTMLRTGVHIALPQNWLALIFPRSSIGSKTPLRLSNSVGVIDEEYRGPLGVLYDNVSDSEITFQKGDRIAQMLIMPSYKFKGKQVDSLPSSSRGENGFGSTGK